MKNETQDSITTWQYETFGKTTPWDAFQRMQLEYWELRNACYEGDVAKIATELADVYITLVRIAQEINVDLQTEVNAKMEINRNRK